jgi:hypothetical protein
MDSRFPAFRFGQRKQIVAAMSRFEFWQSAQPEAGLFAFAVAEHPRLDYLRPLAHDFPGLDVGKRIFPGAMRDFIEVEQSAKFVGHVFHGDSAFLHVETFGIWIHRSLIQPSCAGASRKGAGPKEKQDVPIFVEMFEHIILDMVAIPLAGFQVTRPRIPPASSEGVTDYSRKFARHQNAP